jgi:hypothetical protein
MRIRHTVIAAALAAVLGGLIVPALAEMPAGSQMMQVQDMGTGMGGHMGHGMTSGGMMSDRMMGDGMMGGCMGMMQSMNNGNGRPNSQWQKHLPADRSMPN